ncbi:methyltransferase [Saccharospirillum sp. MSK14-1]|uniref:DNA-binding transcriptional regulator Fis n=1 Tax=Saccharospirillum sp. MSK14-1 TaxID=1897632 RepID=UPI000D389E0B|nr:DNA-binding transcriptional regulator Fis [Saccharospirillum sp. MSK14-1]PTY35858.1 methyltransferase [Saccharospirillum sp. MSK14-1]
MSLDTFVTDSSSAQPQSNDTFQVDASVEQPQTLRDSVEIAMRNYFAHLEGQDVANVYQMVMSEVEAPMLEAVMRFCRDNQTKASQVLGLNRGTLRKKLKQYGLL